MMLQRHNTIRIAGAALLALAAAGLPACRGDRSAKPPRQFLPDMDDSPKWRPQTHTGFYADGRAMRQPAAGAVAFGASTDPNDPERAKYLREDVAFYTGKDARGEIVANMPASAIEPFMPAGADESARREAAVKAMLDRGAERFGIYCAPCHGFDGKGGGTVGQRLSLVPANLHEDRLRDRKTVAGGDGHIFDVIRNGWNNGNMPGYAHAMSEKDSWAIVMYVRAIQASTGAKLEDVPEAMRARLQQTKPPPAPAPAAPAAAPAPAPGKPGGTN